MAAMSVAYVHDYLENTRRVFEALPEISRAPHEPWTSRYDLFYDDEVFALPALFKPPGRYEHLRSARTGKTVKRIHITEYGSVQPRLMRHSLHVREVVAALMQWHQMTTRQLGCQLGVEHANLHRYLRPLYINGLLERAEFGQHPENRGKYDQIHQLHYGEPLHRWLAQFNNDDWAAITAASPVEAPSFHVRHNLLMSELMLRIQEAGAPIAAALGERAAAATGLLKAAGNDQLCGDGLIVRPDGLRIVIELSQRQNADDIKRKMLRWARLLAPSRLRSAATVVVFVNAARDDHGKAQTRLRRVHAEVLSAEGLGSPTRPATAAQVGSARAAVLIASWRDWFPEEGVIDATFPTLPVGYLKPGNRNAWGRVNLLGDGPNTVPAPDPDPDLRVPIEAANHLYAVPSWLGNKPRKL
ncbi:MAG TPA: hypothetical protein VHD87_12625 [Acidimicrobiales bacterium]|nr:hypothetical protein [Acidimicrobiales bacterium]